jgi:ABC-2 type transport system permease protein
VVDRRQIRPLVALGTAQIRSQASYRASFAIDLLTNLFQTALELLTVLVMFRVAASLGGFLVSESLLMACLTLAAFPIADMFFGNVEKLRNLVRSGQLDTMLLRPLGLLAQLLAADIAVRRLTRVALSVAMLAVVAHRAHIDWTAARIALVALTPLFGAALFGAIFVAANAVAFWWIDSGEISNSVTYGGQTFSIYPVTVYTGWFGKLFSFGLGFAFVAYYPALALLDRPDPLGLPVWVGYLSPVVAAIAVGLAGLLWRTGVRQYQSTGS